MTSKLGMFERNRYVYTEIIPNAIKKEVVRLIRGRVEVDKIISMNDWRCYDIILAYVHDKYIRINRKFEGNYVSGLASFWSFVKRRLYQFNGVYKNFELHLKECKYRYSKSSDTLLSELKELTEK